MGALHYYTMLALLKIELYINLDVTHERTVLTLVLGNIYAVIGSYSQYLKDNKIMHVCWIRLRVEIPLAYVIYIKIIVSWYCMCIMCRLVAVTCLGVLQQ